MTLGVIAATAAAAGVAQQQQQADIANKYEKIAYGQRKEAAVEEFAALRDREAQERRKASQDITRLTSDARKATAAAKLGALETGTRGASVAALLSDFERTQLEGLGIIEGNLAATTGQIRRAERAAGRIQGPNKAYGPLDTGLGIVASGLGVASAGLGTYGSAKATLPPKTTL